MKTILVIEDESLTRNIFLESLKNEGFHTISAENGLIGVQQAQEQSPDLVVCDITLPELDGYGVLTILRQNSTTAIIPFIFLTAKTHKTEVRQGMELYQFGIIMTYIMGRPLLIPYSLCPVF